MLTIVPTLMLLTGPFMVYHLLVVTAAYHFMTITITEVVFKLLLFIWVNEKLRLHYMETHELNPLIKIFRIKLKYLSLCQLLQKL